MATTTVFPNGDVATTHWTDAAAGTTNLYTNVDEGTSSPNDADYVTCSNSGSSIWFSLGDMPADFVTPTGVTITLRLNRTSAKGDYRHFSSVTLQSSESGIALTASAAITDTTTITTYTYSPSITGRTNKTSWNGARLAISMASSSGGGSCRIYAAQVAITYTAASTGTVTQYNSTHSPGTIENITGIGTTAWVNPSNAGSSDDSYAVYTDVASGGSNYLRASNFGFTLPTSDCAVAGIVYEIEYKANYAEGGGSGRRLTGTLRAVKGGTITGSTVSTGTLPTVEAYVSRGDQYAMWGTTFTPSEINASNFGVVFYVTSNFGDEEIGSVDHIRTTVYFDVDGTWSEGGGDTYDETGDGGSVGGSSVNPSKIAIVIIPNSGSLGGSSATLSTSVIQVITNSGALGGSSAVLSGITTVTINNSGVLAGSSAVLSGISTVIIPNSGSLIGGEASISSSGGPPDDVEITGGLLGSGSYSHISLMTDLVAHWPLNETSGIRYDAHSNNNLTDNSSVSYDSGIFENSASFISSNNQYLSISNNHNLDLNNTSFSIAFWVKFDSLTNADNNQYIGILSKAKNGIEYGLSFQYRNIINVFQMQLNNGSAGDAFKTHCNALNFGALSTGVWYFIVGTYDNTTAMTTISINNIENSIKATSPPYDGNYDLCVGRGYNLNRYNFSGKIDSVSIWRRVLTKAEKTKLYNAGVGLNYVFDFTTATKSTSGGSVVSGRASVSFNPAGPSAGYNRPDMFRSVKNWRWRWEWEWRWMWRWKQLK